MEKWAGISKGIRRQLRNQEVWKGQADDTNKLKVDVFAAAPGVGPPCSPPNSLMKGGLRSKPVIRRPVGGGQTLKVTSRACP